MVQIAPSLLAADFMHLEAEVQKIAGHADLLHIDVMDGTFVPNISIGFPIIQQIAPVAQMPLDVHLMTVHPERWFEVLSKAGVSMVSFHLEAAGRCTSRYIDDIHALGMKAGVAIDPDVPVRKLFKYAGKADFFLIMSVFAGFGGQKFIYESLDRIAALKAELAKRGSKALIEVDGGVDSGNVNALRDAGVDIVVAGSSVFHAPDSAAAIENLKVQ